MAGVPGWLQGRGKGLAARKRRQDGSIRTFSSTPATGEGWGAGGCLQSPTASELINSAYIMKTPLKPLQSGEESSGIGEYIKVLVGSCARRECGNSASTHAYEPSIWLFLNCNHYHESIIIGKLFSHVLWAFSQIIEAEEGVMGTLEL